MKLFYIAFVLCAGIFSCVKNDPFIKPYTVPATYDFEDTDSTSKAALIMVYGIKNYLATGVNGTLKGAIADSLWDNTDSTFTPAMVPDFIYADTILNKMTIVKLANETEDADSLKAYIDSAVDLSKHYNIAGSNGVAGWQTVSVAPPVKHLFSRTGIEYTEVWEKAMLGALALNNIIYYLNNAGTTNGDNWTLAYNYCGLPLDYDPSFNYEATPVKINRPLGIGALLANAKSSNIHIKVFEDFKRGRIAINAFDARVVDIARDSLKVNIEKTLAINALTYLDAVKAASTMADKLYHLSQAYGIMIALKYRETADMLDEDAYWALRDIMKANFYTLIQESGYTTITGVRNTIAAAYGL